TIVPGQSGSGLWINTATGPYIYGVISGYSGSTAANSQAFASRITQSVFTELQSWRNSDQAPLTASAPAHPFPSATFNLFTFNSLQHTASAAQGTSTASSAQPQTGTPVQPQTGTNVTVNKAVTTDSAVTTPVHGEAFHASQQQTDA